MPALSIPLDRLRALLPTGRVRSALLWVLTGLGFGGVLLYQAVLIAIDAAPDVTALVSMNALGAVAALSLYHALRPLVQPRTPGAVRSLWTALLVLVLSLAGAYGFLMATGGGGLVDVRTGLPSDGRSLLQASVLGVLEVVLAFVLLHTLRGLVLFKRTRASLRNWNLMLALTALSALAAATMNPLALEDPLLVKVLAVAAVVLMVANAFRLSWIVYLQGRDKGLALALCAALFALLLVLLTQHHEGLAAVRRAKEGIPLDAALVPLGQIYSQTLHQFATSVMAFGMLYAVTAILSLLFHLPTASAFEQKTGEMKAFQTLTELSSKVLDQSQLVVSIAEAPVKAGVAEAAWLALIDPSSGSLAPQVVASHGLPTHRVETLADTAALLREVSSKGAPLLLGKAATDHRVKASPGDGVGSLIALPLVAAGDTLGALFAVRSYADGFEQDDISVLATFAGQAALSISNARLFAETLEKQRMANELAIARQVQQRLLPQTLPEVPGLGLAVRGQSALEVGGDYYDVVRIDDHTLGVIVADVSGKGTAAAFYMAELKGIFRAVSRLTHSPADFLCHANEALSGTLSKQAFITAVYGVIDTQSGTFTFARAGHCPIVHTRQTGEACLLRATGLGLGLDPGPLFRRTLREESLALQHGDTLTLYSDGLVESRSATGEEYGYARLQHVAAAHAQQSAPALLDALLADRQAFAGHDHLDDDLTLVVLRWHGMTTLPPAATPPPPQNFAALPRLSE